MNTITIKKNALQALMLFSSVKDVRYYLQGVHIETGPAGARLHATDGRVIAAHFIPGEYEVSDGIIPAELVINALKIAGKVSKIDIGIEAGASRPCYTVAGLRSEGIDGKYPDAQRVFPKGALSGEAGQFDPQYLAVLAKAAKTLGNPHTAVLCHNGASNAALVDFGRDDFACIIMPMRANANGYETPAWVTLALAPPIEQAA